MKRVFRAITVAFLGVCLDGALVAQAIAPRTFRAVAGESRTGALRDGVPSMTAITSARTTPPLEFPIRVETAEPLCWPRLQPVSGVRGGRYLRVGLWGSRIN